ncbi:MAG: ribose 5-phosphate isomerase B [Lachnospiraceae bacterium]|nr:ribose 5-phosphate isomerase B [Lachnospiraceae bacterium]
MKIGWGSDHAGVVLKRELMAYMEEKGYENVDYGNYDENDRADDYPEFGRKVGEAVAAGEVEQGVLICGTGIGISLTANKVPGIRAAVCSEPYSAHMAKLHNNANIIAFGARVVGRDLAKMILDEFFDTEFEGGRHQRRVDQIMATEAFYSKKAGEKE